MSQLKVDTITDEEGTGAPDFPNGLNLGGAPIIESDENANGRFVKFADGTMICTGDLTSVASSTATGNLFRSDDSVVTLPATFQNADFAVAARSNSTIGWVNSQSTTTTTFTYRRFSSTTSGSTGGAYAAIGRWK